jgi:hypothetical protein
MRRSGGDALSAVSVYDLLNAPAEYNNLTALHPDVAARPAVDLEQQITVGRSMPGSGHLQRMD